MQNPNVQADQGQGGSLRNLIAHQITVKWTRKGRPYHVHVISIFNDKAPDYQLSLQRMVDHYASMADPDEGTSVNTAVSKQQALRSNVALYATEPVQDSVYQTYADTEIDSIVLEFAKLWGAETGMRQTAAEDDLSDADIYALRKLVAEPNLRERLTSWAIDCQRVRMDPAEFFRQRLAEVYDIDPKAFNLGEEIPEGEYNRIIRIANEEADRIKTEADDYAKSIRRKADAEADAIRDEAIRAKNAAARLQAEALEERSRNALTLIERQTQIEKQMGELTKLRQELDKLSIARSEIDKAAQNRMLQSGQPGTHLYPAASDRMPGNIQATPAWHADGNPAAMTAHTPPQAPPVSEPTAPDPDHLSKTQEEAERQQREETERLTQEEAERQQREETERLTQEEAERLAQEEAERQQREEDERLAQEEAERQQREEDERLAQEEDERLAQEETERHQRENAKAASTTPESVKDADMPSGESGPPVEPDEDPENTGAPADETLLADLEASRQSDNENYGNLEDGLSEDQTPDPADAKQEPDPNDSALIDAKDIEDSRSQAEVMQYSNVIRITAPSPPAWESAKPETLMAYLEQVEPEYLLTAMQGKEMIATVQWSPSRNDPRKQEVPWNLFNLYEFVCGGWSTDMSPRQHSAMIVQFLNTYANKDIRQGEHAYNVFTYIMMLLSSGQIACEGA